MFSSAKTVEEPKVVSVGVGLRHWLPLPLLAMSEPLTGHPPPDIHAHPWVEKAKERVRTPKLAFALEELQVARLVDLDWRQHFRNSLI